jgi:hypothetical protein
MRNPRRIALDRLLVPKETYWGRAFGDRQLSQSDLDVTARLIAESPVEGGYGERTREFRRTPRGFWLPAGYDAIGHPNRWHAAKGQRDEEFFTGSAAYNVPDHLQALFRSQGFALDQHGRPCKPDAEELVADSRIGLNTGIGFGHFWGEWVVLNVVPLAGDRVALTKRQGAGKTIPSVIGVSIKEWHAGIRPVHRQGILAAASRLAWERGGIGVPADDPSLEIVYALRPTSALHTWNWWTLTVVVRIRLTAGTSHHIRPSAPDTVWVPVSDLGHVMGGMLEDHQAALQMAVA